MNASPTSTRELANRIRSFDSQRFTFSSSAEVRLNVAWRQDASPVEPAEHRLWIIGSGYCMIGTLSSQPDRRCSAANFSIAEWRIETRAYRIFSIKFNSILLLYLMFESDIRNIRCEYREKPHPTLSVTNLSKGSSTLASIVPMWITLVRDPHILPNWWALIVVPLISSAADSIQWLTFCAMINYFDGSACELAQHCLCFWSRRDPIYRSLK